MRFRETYILIFFVFTNKIYSKTPEEKTNQILIQELINQKETNTFFNEFKKISGKQMEEMFKIKFPPFIDSIQLENSEKNLIQKMIKRLKKFWFKNQLNEYKKCKSIIDEMFQNKKFKLESSYSTMKDDKQKIKECKNKILDKQFPSDIDDNQCLQKQNKFVEFICIHSELFKNELDFNIYTCLKFEDKLLKY